MLYFWGTIDSMPNYFQIAKEVDTETECRGFLDEPCINTWWHSGESPK